MHSLVLMGGSNHPKVAPLLGCVQHTSLHSARGPRWELYQIVGVGWKRKLHVRQHVSTGWMGTPTLQQLGAPVAFQKPGVECPHIGSGHGL